MKTTRRRGGVLILVLFCVVLLLTLVLSAATVVRLRWTLAADAFQRARERDAALSVVAQALHGLAADTRPVDSLDAAWCDLERTGGIRLSDEESRLDVRTASAAALAALFTVAADLPPRQAETLARAVESWLDASSEPPAALEQLLAVPGLSPALLECIKPHATVHGLGRVNVNTVGEPVLQALLASVGASRETQALLLSGLRTARRHGTVCETIGAASLAALLLGPGRIPAPAPAQALAALAPLLDVRSTTFRGATAPVTPRHPIDFVYDRSSGVFRRWTE